MGDGRHFHPGCPRAQFDGSLIMAKKSPVSPTLVAGALFVYHVVALMKDAERWSANLKQYRAQPDAGNFVRLLLAEGILLKDVGFLM